MKVSQRRIQQIILQDKKQRDRVSKSQAAAAEAEALADQNIIYGDYRAEGSVIPDGSGETFSRVILFRLLSPIQTLTSEMFTRCTPMI